MSPPLSTVNFPLPTALCLLPYLLVPTTHQSPHCQLAIFYCLLPLAYCLLVTSESPAVLIGLRHFVDRYHVGGDAKGYFILCGCLEHIVKSVLHNPITAAIDAIGRPFVPQPV